MAANTPDCKRIEVQQISSTIFAKVYTWPHYPLVLPLPSEILIKLLGNVSWLAGKYFCAIAEKYFLTFGEIFPDFCRNICLRLRRNTCVCLGRNICLLARPLLLDHWAAFAFLPHSASLYYHSSSILRAAPHPSDLNFFSLLSISQM